MAPIKKDFDSFEEFTEYQLEELVKSNDALEKQEARWIKEEKKEEQIQERERRSAKNPFRRLRKVPLEIISRSLFWFFLGSFLFSFAFVYAASTWWFLWYVISACACIFYAPNRKALKEFIDGWPNIVDLIQSRRK